MASARGEIERYLRTGEHDSLFAAWPGDGLLGRARQGSADLRQALVAVVRARTTHTTVPVALADLDVPAFTRRKVEPMVRGLLPAAELPVVIDMLTRSVVFLTPVTIDDILTRAQFHGTAWRLANTGGFPTTAPEP